MPVPTPHSCIRGSYIFHPAFPSLSQRLQISLLNNQANDLCVLFVCLRLHTFSFIFLSLFFFYLRQHAFFFLFFTSHSLLYCICITIPITFFFFPGYLSTLIHAFVHCIIQLLFLHEVLTSPNQGSSSFYSSRLLFNSHDFSSFLHLRFLFIYALIVFFFFLLLLLSFHSSNRTRCPRSLTTRLNCPHDNSCRTAGTAPTATRVQCTCLSTCRARRAYRQVSG